MKDFQYFFHLSRPLNVLITLLAFTLASFIASAKSFHFLEDRTFWFCLGCLALISATGYWVNDAFDFKIDRVNKPRKVIVNAHLSVKKVLSVYFGVLVGVLTFSFFFLDKSLTLVNITAMGLLFLYAWWLKRTTVVGNVVIAALTALVVYMAALVYTPRMALIWTLIFAFEVTFLREVVKDMEDIEGDLQFKLHTLPIRIGIGATRKVLTVAFLLFWLTCFGPVVEEWLRWQHFNWQYLLASVLLVQLPALWIMVQLQKAESTADFHSISTWLKYLIFLGMVSILFLY